MAKNSTHILRWSRIAVATVVTALLTAVIVSHAMTIPRLAGFLAKVQFLPAAMAFSVGTVVVTLIATLIYGRIYCSTICPLGAFQDIFARLPRMGKRHRRRPSSFYHYREPSQRLRNLFLTVTLLSILLGISVVVTFLDPYSIYSRGCVYILQPAWLWISNFFSSKPVQIAAASITGIATSVVTLGLIAFTASRSGRIFCNTICPVGTTLGYVSKYSVFHIDINTDKCIQCRDCEHVCKSQCIDLTSHVVDMSRCVVCFDCLTVCPNDAIHYTTNRHQLSIPMMMRTDSDSLAGSTTAGYGGGRVDASPGSKLVLDRRAFLATGLVVAASPLVAKTKKMSRLAGGIFNGQQPSEVPVAVTPPGVFDRKEFLDRCTGCGLCISHCMTGVLRPSTTEYGLLRVLHPVKDYDRARCAVGCTRCTNLCPTGALHPLTKEEKLHSPVGLARVDLTLCTSFTKNETCGKCAEACKPEAITMSNRHIASRGLAPVIDPSRCIGCGSCQFVCPSLPSKAIIVSGLT